jgi:uncharacterized lipoprotein YddW (UPF0748 family)
VANIDWPSKPGLSSLQQQAEALALLDRMRSLGLNAAILQVRPTADAFYASPLEPWSEYLTGTQGKAPEPFYDPLAFWIEAAHRRGIELHAWINPYRARHASAKGNAAPGHVSQRMASTVRRYGDMLWLDPAEPAARAHSLAVVADIVRRYDVDGIHIDDYFYPYPVKAQQTKVGDGGTANGEASNLEFPDEAAWVAYRNSGGTLERADWRRTQVDAFVAEMYRSVQAIKPWVKVGVSPFGLGRPERRPAGISGFSQYDQLYANVEHWLEQGWLDYLAPQLYWPIRQTPQAFGVLHDYWLRQNPQARHVYPGLYTSMVGAAQKSWEANEIVEQIALARSRDSGAGHIHFSIAALAQNRLGISDVLERESYAAPALPPAMPWLAGAVPPAPTLHPGESGLLVSWPSEAPPPRMVLWRFDGNTWQVVRLLPGSAHIDAALLHTPLGEAPQAVAVQGLARNGLAGMPAMLRLAH